MELMKAIRPLVFRKFLCLMSFVLLMEIPMDVSAEDKFKGAKFLVTSGSDFCKTFYMKEEFVRPIPKPGEIAVKFKKGLAAEKEGEILKELGLEGQKRSIISGERTLEYYVVAVPSGLEEAWMRIFENLGEVESAAYLDYRIAATSQEFAMHMIRNDISKRQSPSALADLQGSGEATNAILDTSEKFLGNRFRGKSTMVAYKPLERSGHKLEIEVGNIKNEVLVGYNFWEKLQVIIFVFKTEQDRIILSVVISGRYGSGIGNRPATEYSGMEETYYELQHNYTKTLTNDIKNNIKREIGLKDYD